MAILSRTETSSRSDPRLRLTRGLRRVEHTAGPGGPGVVDPPHLGQKFRIRQWGGASASEAEDALAAKDRVRRRARLEQPQVIVARQLAGVRRQHVAGFGEQLLV